MGCLENIGKMVVEQIQTVCLLWKWTTAAVVVLAVTGCGNGSCNGNGGCDDDNSGSDDIDGVTGGMLGEDQKDSGKTDLNCVLVMEGDDSSCSGCNGSGDDSCDGGGDDSSLGAEGVLPSRHIESVLRVFKQFTHNLPSRQVVGCLSICLPP